MVARVADATMATLVTPVAVVCVWWRAAVGGSALPSLGFEPITHGLLALWGWR